jgi:transposase
VEAAWSYRHRPYVGQALAKRQENQPPEIVAYSWAAQCRLSGRFRKLAPTKGQNKAVVAVARELSGFVWGTGDRADGDLDAEAGGRQARRDPRGSYAP